LNLRAFRFPGHIVNHNTNPLALVPLLATRLLRPWKNRFKIAQVDYYVAALKALDVPVYQIADLVDVLLVDIISNSITDLLKQYLLGRLGCNTPELFHRQWQKQSITEFNLVSCEFASFID